MSKNKVTLQNGAVNLARYGGIGKLVNQKGNYTTNPENASYHSAPERKGFYWFLYPFIELFLSKIEQEHPFQIFYLVWDELRYIFFVF